MSYFCLAIGIGTTNRNGDILEVFFPSPAYQPAETTVTAVRKALALEPGNHTVTLDKNSLHVLSETLRGDWDDGARFADTLHAVIQEKDTSRKVSVLCLLETDVAPSTVAEAYLKLHLLSLRHCKPHGVDLSGIFALLPNNAWTSEGAIDLEELEQRQLQARCEGRSLSVNSVDKFPKMTDYVVPSGVRIAHTARVRLGAHLGEGTTVMHEGFVNFNAGTEGPGMIEGRISAGVFVGKGSDLGGGCSTMGTLSGGNAVVISVGEECLIGANAGLGIPLGDRCTIEAGLYVTGGTLVTLLDDTGASVKTCKARELAGKADLLFRRNSMSGSVECKTNRSAIALNEELHANN
ncbi:MAG: 2,3,4,5-tetrahydropyridine-2,6-dicarboxylate N-succinyltransferase [Pseudomonadales bacterium]